MLGIRRILFRFWERLGLVFAKAHDKEYGFWFHAASVGEVRSLKDVVLYLRTLYPNAAVIVSVMTEGGYHTAKNELFPDITMLLPVENYFALKYLLKRYRVRVFFITDTELWPILTKTVSKRVPLLLLNARISDKSLIHFVRFKAIYGSILKCFTYILAQSAEQAERFAVLGSSKNVIVSGNTKYFLPKENDIIPLFSGVLGLVFAAITHKPEEEIFLRAAASCSRIVIAPRHIHRALEVKELALSMGFSVSLFSENLETHVVVVDVLGILERIYISSEKIFIGGSMADIGGHNIFEALKYKKKVAVGIHTENFRDIVPLALKMGVALRVRNEKELGAWLMSPIESPDFSKFFDNLKHMQLRYYKLLEDCVGKCIEK